MSKTRVRAIARNFIGSVLVLTMLIASTAASAKSLTGKWRVTWAQDPNNTNQLSLKQSANRITGTYVNDSKENCKITGTIDQAGAQIALQVACANWGIRMEGALAADRDSVSGSYAAYLDDKGTFVMTRR